MEQTLANRSHGLLYFPRSQTQDLGHPAPGHRSLIPGLTRCICFSGGSRGLQAPEYRVAIQVALATGLSFILLRCDSHHKKFAHTS
jgi:hypothetical protein